MKNTEQRLHFAPVTETPERLDRSIEQMIRWVESEGASRWGARRSLRFAVTGCAAGVLIGILVGPLLHGRDGTPTIPPTMVVIVEPTPELERWVTVDANRKERGFLERPHGELETVYVAGDSSKSHPSSL